MITPHNNDMSKIVRRIRL